MKRINQISKIVLATIAIIVLYTVYDNIKKELQLKENPAYTLAKVSEVNHSGLNKYSIYYKFQVDTVFYVGMENVWNNIPDTSLWYCVKYIEDNPEVSKISFNCMFIYEAGPSTVPDSLILCKTCFR